MSNNVTRADIYLLVAVCIFVIANILLACCIGLVLPKHMKEDGWYYIGDLGAMSNETEIEFCRCGGDSLRTHRSASPYKTMKKVGNPTKTPILKPPEASTKILRKINFAEDSVFLNILTSNQIKEKTKKSLLSPVSIKLTETITPHPEENMSISPTDPTILQHTNKSMKTLLTEASTKSTRTSIELTTDEENISTDSISLRYSTTSSVSIRDAKSSSASTSSTDFITNIASSTDLANLESDRKATRGVLDSTNSRTNSWTKIETKSKSSSTVGTNIIPNVSDINYIPKPTDIPLRVFGGKIDTRKLIVK